MEQKNGFTIIEMLGVVSILVVISLFTFPLIATLMSDSSNSKNEQFLEILYQASETYVELNYDKFKSLTYDEEKQIEIGYINAKILIEEGFLQTDIINPVTKLKLTEEDGIIEVSRNIDGSLKFNYVANQYIVINYIEDLIEILKSQNNYEKKVIVIGRNLDINDDNSYKDVTSDYNGSSIKSELTSGNLIPKSTVFKGKIAGNNYTISNININSNADNVGLFSSMNGATIENINLSGTISGQSNIGLLAGNATNTKINNVSANVNFSYNDQVNSTIVGSLIGKGSDIKINNVVSTTNFTINGSTIGGLVGLLDSDSIILNSTHDGIIEGKDNIGGFVGVSLEATFESLTSNGKVSGINRIGGIVGQSSSDDINSSNVTAFVSGTTDVGGIIGNSSNATVTSTYTINQISGITNVGGIIGYAQGESSVLKSTSSAKIVGTEYIGGLVGNLNMGTIRDCYSISSIDATRAVGGIVGITGDSIIKNNHYSGKIQVNSNSNVGCLVGLSHSSTLENSYFNSDINTCNAIGSSTNDTLTNFAGKTAIEMQTESTYQNWDFTNIWKIESNNYPTLR